jgi:hypothetical protein
LPLSNMIDLPFLLRTDKTDKTTGSDARAHYSNSVGPPPPFYTGCRRNGDFSPPLRSGSE